MAAKFSTLTSDFATMPGTLTLAAGAHHDALTGRVVLPSGTTYSTMTSATTYDLSESQVGLQVVQSSGGSGASTRECGIELILDANNKVKMYQSATGFFGQLVQAGVATTLSLGDFSPSLTSWWRIRESAGRVYWETSQDGLHWLTQANAAHTVVVTALTLSVFSGHFGGVDLNVPDAIVDNLNIAPQVTFVVVTANYDLPDGLDPKGTVSFTPTAPLSNGTTVVAAPVSRDLNIDGILAIPLAANTDPGTTPPDTKYLVLEEINGASRTYYVKVPHNVGASVDLTTLSPGPFA